MELTFRPGRELIFLWAALSALCLSFAWQAWLRYSTSPVPAARQATILSSAGLVQRLEAGSSQEPENAELLAQLGLARLQLVRESGDQSQFALAEMALDEALRLDPQQVDALIGKGQLALARHRFPEALQWGERAFALNSYRADALGILVDAKVELGRYDDALTHLRAMMALKPALASFSRVAYLRELHGDMAGAIEAQEQAVRTGIPGHEGTLWAQVELGHMHFENGNLSFAEAAFLRALDTQPNHPGALAGLAQLRAAEGDLQSARETLEALANTSAADPGLAVSLGELHLALDETKRAASEFERARDLLAQEADLGTDITLELAQLEATYGQDPGAALQLALKAYQTRPSVQAADVLSWAFYRVGELEQAWRFHLEALRLGTRDPMFYYHGGLIALARGDDALARDRLGEALSIHPEFSIVFAPRARELLAEPGGTP